LSISSKYRFENPSVLEGPFNEVLRVHLPYQPVKPLLIFQASDKLNKAPIPQLLHEPGMEGLICCKVTGNVTLFRRGLNSLYGAPELVRARGMNRSGDLFDGWNLEHEPKLEDLIEIFLIELDDTKAAISHRLYETLVRQVEQRLADWCSRDS